MKTPDPKPGWAASDLPDQGREDLRVLKELGGGPYDIEAGLAGFEERIANARPGQMFAPRSVLVGALVISGLVGVAGFATLRTDVSASAPQPSAAVAPLASASALQVVVETAPAPTSSIPSISVDALPSVATAPPRPLPVAAATTSIAPAPGQAEAADPIDAEVRHASNLRVVARTDPRAALSLAAEGDRLFPNGLLHTEREAIAIEALARLDRADEARTRASGFLSAYPTHPRAGRVRAISRGERPWEP